MLKVVRIKALYDDSIKYYRVNQIDGDIKRGEYFIGETCFGEDIVQVVCNKVVEFSKEQWDSMTKNSGKKSHFSFEPQLIRRASDNEVEKSKGNIDSAKAYRNVFEEKVKEYNIDLKIINLHYALAKDRLICIYMAPARVDFRDFVRDLGHSLRQRIELFQISSHFMPAAQFKGEFGVCGREMCCASFCPNPSKVAACMDSINKSPKNLGCCGRIKCCKVYELDAFIDNPFLKSVHIKSQQTENAAENHK